MTRSFTVCAATLLAMFCSTSASAATLTVADLIEGDLVITEIMKDPSKVADYRGEWFEIYNNSGYDIDATGLYLWDAGTDDVTVTTSLFIAAGDYAVLAVSTDSTLNGGLPGVDYKTLSSIWHLDNTSDEIYLVTDSYVIDTVEYTTTGWPSTAGYSLSLDPALMDDLSNDSATSWCKASSTYGLGDHGTPGSANDSCAIDDDGDGWSPDDGDCDDTDASVYPGAMDVYDLVDNDCDALIDEDEVEADDIVVTEIQYNPAKVSDNYGEWFEIVNSSTRDIDLVGWVFKGSDGNTFTVTSSLVVAAGDTAVFGCKSDTTLNGGVTVDYAYSRGTFKLENTTDDILVTVGGVTVSSASYGAGYPLSAGYALNLDPSYNGGGFGADALAWCVPSTTYGLGDRGTPGSTNEECDIIDTGYFIEGDLLITEIMKDPAKVADYRGEWFELYNNWFSPVDLYGLVVMDTAGKSFTIDQHVLLDVGEYAVLSVSDDSALNGGLPWVNYKFKSSAFSLGNGADDIWVFDGATTIDAVMYDDGVTFHDLAGTSLSLDPTMMDTTSNDSGSSWCAGSSTYGLGDIGTPGAANDSCP